MWQKQHSRTIYRESIKALEADIHHANRLASTIPRDYNGDCIQMRVSYSPFASFFQYLIEWLDYSCTDNLPNYLGLLHILIYKVYVDGIPKISPQERKASLKEFYAVIYPSLRQLENEFTELDDDDRRKQGAGILNRNKMEEKRINLEDDLERDDECGICMETGTKVVLPNCSNSMCINCFHDWKARSQSCPFCRGSLARVNSKDLWVLTSPDDVIDTTTLAKENLRRFHLYIETLPPVLPDTQLFIYDHLIY